MDKIKSLLEEFKALDQMEQKLFMLEVRELRNSQDAFRVGSKVSWTHKGRSFLGTVSKLLPKNIAVDTDSGQWRIHPTHLKLVD